MSLVVWVAVMFASCQKEEAGLQPETSNQQLTGMPVITYDDVFEQDGKAPVQKKYTWAGDVIDGVEYPMKLWFQQFRYIPVGL